LKETMFRRISVVALIFFCALYFAIWSYVQFTVYRAKQLIEDAERLQVGVTSEDQVRGFSHNHGGQTYDTDHGKVLNESDIEASSWVFVLSPSLRFNVGSSILPRLGFRQWTTQVILDVRDGHLVRSMFGIGVIRSDGLQLEEFTTIGLKPFIDTDDRPYRVYDAHITGPPADFLGVAMRPDANPNERERGLNFNFRCLTRLRECRHACELMPAAWNDLPLDRRIHYADHHELVVDAECRGALGGN
jgi:hypothetical protein